MFTPQEIEERSAGLEKAVFGGYSVSAVEDLLGPLQEDYAALYQENASLKSKMKVLAEKLEEYREREDNIKNTLLKAQAAADEMVANAERQSARMLADSEERLRNRSQELSAEVLAEQERAREARESTARFIVELEERIQAQLVALERLKERNMAEGDAAPAQQPPAPGPAEEPKSRTEGEKAEEIGAGITRIFQGNAQTDAPDQDLGDTRIIEI